MESCGWVEVDARGPCRWSLSDARGSRQMEARTTKAIRALVAVLGVDDELMA
jgi:hypothetical protein